MQRNTTKVVTLLPLFSGSSYCSSGNGVDVAGTQLSISFFTWTTDRARHHDCCYHYHLAVASMKSVRYTYKCSFSYQTNAKILWTTHKATETRKSEKKERVISLLLTLLPFPVQSFYFSAFYVHWILAIFIFHTKLTYTSNSLTGPHRPT